MILIHLDYNCAADTVLAISDMREVYEKVSSVSPNWFNLGLALELSYTDLTYFRETYHGDDSVCLREALAHRLVSGSPLTWGGMCTALRDVTVARNVAADMIEKHFRGEWLYCLVAKNMVKLTVFGRGVMQHVHQIHSTRMLCMYMHRHVFSFC